MRKPNSLSENLGRAIRKRRCAKGLTQEKLAELAGLHRSYIGDVERGARNITVFTLASMTTALETTISDLTVGIDAIVGDFAEGVENPGA